MLKRPLRLSLLLCLMLGSAAAQQHCPVPPVEALAFTDPVTDSLGLQGRTEIFDAAVKTALDGFIDPTFRGHDFQAMAAAARPSALAATSDAAFYQQMRALFDAVGDVHLAFDSPQERQWLQSGRQSSSSSFVGIGALTELTSDNLLRLHRVYAGAPATLAGLQPGETIVAVDGVCPLIEHLRGENGTTVRLTVRDLYGVAREVTVTRAPVKTPDIEGSASRLAGDFGYLELSTFYNDHSSEFYEGLLEGLLRSGPLRGLVLDLRGNGGGTPEQWLRFISLLLPAGETLVEGRQRDGTAGFTRVTTARDLLPELQTLPLVVLVDHDSVSAAEIVAAVLQQRGRARLVGQDTPGQTASASHVPLPHDAQLTLGRYDVFLPNGQRVGAGVKVDVPVSDQDILWLPPDHDHTVARALQLLQTGQ